VGADRQDDLPAAGGDLVGQLDPGGRAADDEHPAGGQVVGPAVGVRVHLVDGGVQRRRGGWPGGGVAPAGRDDHGVGEPQALTGVDGVPVLGAAHRDDLGAGEHGRAAVQRVGGEVVGDLAGGQVALGSGPV